MKHCDERIFDRSYMASLARGEATAPVRAAIFEATAWMPAETNLKARCLALHLGYTAETFPRCPCGNPVIIERAYQKTFTQYCSDPCAKKYRDRLPEGSKEKLADKEWMYKHRMILKMSVENIAEILGCSITPVNKALAAHNMKDVKYNRKANYDLVRESLSDKEWLTTEHHYNKKTLRTIAKELDTHVETVREYMAIHGIKANESNSYDRKINRISGEHQEVVDFLREIYAGEILINNRSTIGSELDIILPERKLAIEYNGLYSHLWRPEQKTVSAQKGRNYHLFKTLQAQDQDLALNHIFSDDWVHRKEIWKSILRSKLGVPIHRIGARECEIVVPSKDTKNAFLRANHIQGNDKSSEWFGLEYNGQIVAMMTFGKPRFSKDHQHELLRFCVLKDWNVMGGFGRLLTTFESTHSGRLVSYADYSRSRGDVYRKSGFTLERLTPPTFWFVDLVACERRHWSYYRADPVKAKTTPKIWDCGTLIFSKNMKS